MESIKTTTLKINEILLLNAEITGIDNPSKASLLSEKLPLSVKYHLTKLSRITQEEKDDFDKLKNRLIQELGKETEDGQFTIDIEEEYRDENGVLRKRKTESFTQFQQQIISVLETEKSIAHHNFTIDDVSKLETEHSYPVFFKLIG